jgi:flagellar biosynthesis GTPase FlhF
MKKFILIIVTIVFFIYPSICLSSYLIELKNGSTFITNHYCKEGRQIKFYYRGGVVGIQKDFVTAIRESDVAYEEEEVYQKVPEKEIADKTEKSREKKDASKSSEETTEQARLEKEIERLTEESNKAWNKYAEISEYGSKAERDEARKKAFEIDIKRKKLREQVKKSSVQSDVPPSGKGI